MKNPLHFFLAIPAMSLLLSTCDVARSQTVEQFMIGWRFHPGDVTDGQRPSLDDSQWKTLDLPHDWSIEGLGSENRDSCDCPVLHIVRGEWKFKEGDNLDWKAPEFGDGAWQVVHLPSTWEAHSNYTADNVFGWYRREIEISSDLRGKDVLLDLGKIDDADETYFNGVKVGGLGTLPPNYTTAWDMTRSYRVPHELVHYGGKNIVAVRVFDGVYGGGIYSEAVRVTEGPFSSTCPGGSGAGYVDAGTAWYRKSFTLPPLTRGQRVFVEFDGVYMNSDVWINGVHAGNRPYGYSSFEYELTPHLKAGGARNVLAVKVDVEQPCSRWYSGAGIYRKVRLKVLDPVHIAHWGTSVTTPHSTDSAAVVEIRTMIRNQAASSEHVTLENTIYDQTGHACAHGSAGNVVPADSVGPFTVTLNLPRPKLWSLEEPTLYRVATVVRVDGRVADSTITSFGIRSFEFTADKGFFLNGKHVEIKGVCLHHDQGCLGSAVRTRSMERQLEIMRSMGCNAIRMSHNPPAPELLDLCDRMGMLVMDEAFDEWKRPKTKYGYGRFFDQWSERDMRDMVRRDKNHPSIVLWSIGNEIPEQFSADAYEMASRLVTICHEEDPTRPTTSACNEPGAAVANRFFKPLDVLGINYNMPFYDSLKGKATLIGSETTSANSTRGEYNLIPNNGRLESRGDFNNQCSSYNDSSAETTFKTLRHAPWVAGQFAWSGFDYIGEPTPFGWPSVSSYFGIVDLCGFPKDRFYLYQSQWTDTPMVHLLPHWNWQGFEGQVVPVWCYSNCESVELFLNGTSLGERRFDKGSALHIAWDVPYRPGTLKVVAKNHGTAVCSDQVVTAGPPARVVLTPDRNVIRASGDDLSYIKVAIVDAQGNPCPDARNVLKLKVSGNAFIAGTGNGDPTSHEYFNANERAAFHGLALVVLQSTARKGTATLTVTSDGLAGSEVAIQTQ